MESHPIHPKNQIIKKQTVPLSNKIFPKLPDEGSLSTSKKPFKDNLIAIFQNNKLENLDINQECPKISPPTLEQGTEIDGAQTFGAEKSINDSIERSIPDSIAKVSNLKNRVASMKLKLPFHIGDLKKNESLNQYQSKFQGYDTSGKLNAIDNPGQSKDLRIKLNSLVSLNPDTNDQQSNQNLIDEPLSAGRIPNFHYTDSRDNSFVAKDNLQDTPTNNMRTITKMIGLVTRKSSLS